jgi:hypothetical protein
VKNKNDNDFASTFISLKNILKKYEKHLTVISDKPKNYNLNAGYDEKRRADIYFGGVVINKNYVSFHLMPVYVNPKLLEGISPGLRKRMQGKSCFNFKKVDKELFKELSNLTKQGFEFYKINWML